MRLEPDDAGGPAKVAARVDAEVTASELQTYVRTHGANLVFDHLREAGSRGLPSRHDRELIALGLDAGLAATLDYLTTKGTLES